MEYEEALKDILTCDKEKLKELGIWDKIYDKGIDGTLHIQIHIMTKTVPFGSKRYSTLLHQMSIRCC
jgi:hypothetical protein